MHEGRITWLFHFRAEKAQRTRSEEASQKGRQQGRSRLVLALKRVAWSILDCARRTSTFRACAFREQEDDQATLSFLFQHPAMEPNRRGKH